MKDASSSDSDEGIEHPKAVKGSSKGAQALASTASEKRGASARAGCDVDDGASSGLESNKNLGGGVS